MSVNSRMAGADHEHALCRRVHLAGSPNAADCVACQYRRDGKALCVACAFLSTFRQWQAAQSPKLPSGDAPIGETATSVDIRTAKQFRYTAP